jgi:hypothetical protein
MFWKDIASFEGKYQINEIGQVRSIVIDHAGKILKDRIITNNISSANRAYVTLFDQGNRCHYCVSLLMAKYHGIPNPLKHGYVLHKNFNNSDFTKTNLEWCSLSQRKQIDGLKNQSKYWGVFKKKGKGTFLWAATIFHDKTNLIGLYETEIEAANAYNDYVLSHTLSRPLNDLNKLYEARIHDDSGFIPLKDFSGYGIAKNGDIISFERVLKSGRRVGRKILKPIYIKNKGLMVSLGKGSKVRVSKLMVDTFLSHRYFETSKIFFKDGDVTNCDLENIYVESPKPNSGYYGVTPVKGVKNRWQAQLNYKGNRVYIGRFKDIIEAAKAYNLVVKDNQMNLPLNMIGKKSTPNKSKE